MSAYPENPGPLPPLRLCDIATPNPVKGEGALGNKSKGMMQYRGADMEELVKTLQQMLIALGYDVGEAGVDGKFGNGTEAAVKAYQKNGLDWEDKPLKVDGLVGPRTSDSLNRKMVGIWYDLYQTPVELSGKKALFTITNDALKAGVPIDCEKAGAAKIVVNGYATPKVEPKLRVARNDFFVLTPKKEGMKENFQPSDRVVIEVEDVRYELRRKDGEVFIRPGVFVAGMLGADYNGSLIPEGDGWLWVEDQGGKHKCEDIPIRILPDTARAKKTAIPMSDKGPKFHIAIIANPGIQEAGKMGNDKPFIRDKILKDRPSFHRRVIMILESLFESAEDAFRDEEIEPYIRIFTYFDDSLPADADNSLLRKNANFSTNNIVGPRSIDLPGLLNGFLSRIGEKADVVVGVSGLNFRCSAWFTTDDGDGEAYKLDGVSYKYGTNVKTPGSFADTVYLLPENRGYDKLTPIHEFLHAMSEKDRGRITDLYHDSYNADTVNVNKKQKSGQKIPAVFGKLNSTSYKSDAPDGSYIGRGGLGYPGSEGINTTYGPELIDSSSCNVMDNFTSSKIDWKKCRLDRLSHQYVVDRMKAKIKNRA